MPEGLLHAAISSEDPGNGPQIDDDVDLREAPAPRPEVGKRPDLSAVYPPDLVEAIQSYNRSFARAGHSGAVRDLALVREVLSMYPEEFRSLAWENLADPGAPRPWSALDAPIAGARTDDAGASPSGESGGADDREPADRILELRKKADAWADRVAEDTVPREVLDKIRALDEKETSDAQTRDAGVPGGAMSALAGAALAPFEALSRMAREPFRDRSAKRASMAYRDYRSLLADLYFGADVLRTSVAEAGDRKPEFLDAALDDFASGVEKAMKRGERIGVDPSFLGSWSGGVMSDLRDRASGKPWMNDLHEKIQQIMNRIAAAINRAISRLGMGGDNGADQVPA